MNNFANRQTINETTHKKQIAPYIGGFILGIIGVICITALLTAIFGIPKNIDIYQLIQRFGDNQKLTAFFLFGAIFVIHLTYLSVLSVPVFIFAVYKQLQRSLANIACLVAIYIGLSLVLFIGLLISGINLVDLLSINVTYHALYSVLSAAFVFRFTLPKPRE